VSVTLADLRPGDLMFGPIGGLIPGAFPVGAGQLLLADRTARLSWKRWRRIRHVGVVVKEAREWVGIEARPDLAPKLVQAMPRGAEEIELLAPRHWTPEYVYIRPQYLDAGVTLNAQGRIVAACARGYIGTPYNFLTYAALAVGPRGLVHLPLTERTLRRWISSRKDMMCSQLADQALAGAGFHVFDDGRLPQDVVPAELFRALLDLPGTQYVIPGQVIWQDGATFHQRQMT
jgi:hypothetical protein